LPEEIAELLGRHFREVAGHRVVFVKTPVDAEIKALNETPEIDPRTQGRAQTARIMVTVMHASLIVIGSTLQKIVALFEENNVAVAAAQLQRDQAAEKTAADDHGVSFGAHAVPLFPRLSAGR
jgi:hypothetical protein